MKTASCILCGSSDLRNSHHIEFENKNYLYDFCNNCNFTFQNPWPSIEIESIYNDEKYWNSSNVYNNKNEEKPSAMSSSQEYYQQEHIIVRKI